MRQATAGEKPARCNWRKPMQQRRPSVTKNKQINNFKTEFNQEGNLGGVMLVKGEREEKKERVQERNTWKQANK